MEKNFLVFVVFVFTNILNAQVGINTSDPKATLDINGNLKIRNLPVLTSLSSSQTILLRDTTPTTGDFEIKEISSDILVLANANAYYATKTGSWSLLDLGLGNYWSKVNLTGATDTKLGTPSLFNNGVYKAVQSGTYVVNYELQFASGVNLEVLGGKKLGILKNNVLWDEKLFEAVRVAINVPLVLNITLAALPVTSTKLTSLIQLNKDDTVTFAVNVEGLLPIDLTLLSSAKVNIYIYKISN